MEITECVVPDSHLSRFLSSVLPWLRKCRNRPAACNRRWGKCP